MITVSKLSIVETWYLMRLFLLVNHGLIQIPVLWMWLIMQKPYRILFRWNQQFMSLLHKPKDKAPQIIMKISTYKLMIMSPNQVIKSIRSKSIANKMWQATTPQTNLKNNMTTFWLGKEKRKWQGLHKDMTFLHSLRFLPTRLHETWRFSWKRLYSITILLLYQIQKNGRKSWEMKHGQCTGTKIGSWFQKLSIKSQWCVDDFYNIKEGFANSYKSRFKTRLMAKDFTHVEEIDYNENFSFVMKYKIIRIMCSSITWNYSKWTWKHQFFTTTLKKWFTWSNHQDMKCIKAKT